MAIQHRYTYNMSNHCPSVETDTTKITADYQPSELITWLSQQGPRRYGTSCIEQLVAHIVDYHRWRVSVNYLFGSLGIVPVIDPDTGMSVCSENPDHVNCRDDTVAYPDIYTGPPGYQAHYVSSPHYVLRKYIQAIQQSDVGEHTETILTQSLKKIVKLDGLSYIDILFFVMNYNVQIDHQVVACLLGNKKFTAEIREKRTTEEAFREERLYQREDNHSLDYSPELILQRLAELTRSGVTNTIVEYIGKGFVLPEGQTLLDGQLSTRLTQEIHDSPHYETAYHLRFTDGSYNTSAWLVYLGATVEQFNNVDQILEAASSDEERDAIRQKLADLVGADSNDDYYSTGKLMVYTKKMNAPGLIDWVMMREPTQAVGKLSCWSVTGGYVDC
jgi:hypothetical protein